MFFKKFHIPPEVKKSTSVDTLHVGSVHGSNTDSDPAFEVNADLDPDPLSGFDDYNCKIYWVKKFYCFDQILKFI